MITGLLALGAFYYALKDEKLSDATPTAPVAPDAPVEPPKPLTPEGDDYRTTVVAEGDQNDISLLQIRRGLMYDDGSGGYTWEDSGFLRGNAKIGFVRASKAVGGTITFTMNGTKYENIIVYKTEQLAIEEDEEEEYDPTDPTKPQAPPQDDDEDKPEPPKPNRPPMPGFGGGVQSPFGGF